MTVEHSTQLTNWLNDMLLLDNEERASIVDDMLSTYIKTCSVEFPEQLNELLLYLQEEEHRIEFKKALNNINLVITSIFIVRNTNEYFQAVRELLLASKEDSIHSQAMKKYYISNLNRDDFSGIIYNEEEYAIVEERINYYKQQYSLFYS